MSGGATTEAGPGRRAPEEGPVPVESRVRMPLLTLITQQSLDEDYVVAARRRAAEEAAAVESGRAGPGPGRARRPRRTAGVVVAAFGLLVTVAALQNHRNAGVDDESRASLITRIDAAKAQVARQQQRQANLSARNLTLQRQLSQLTTSTQATTARTTRVAAASGFGAVTGGGLQITIQQAPDADPNQQVKPLDLALVVNGLWGAGAEAVSINGQRMTSVSPILSSGTTIEVNDVGIAPPYVVQAIGDERTLQARFFDTTSGLDFAAVADRYQIVYSVDNEDALTLPAAPSALRTLRSARAGSAAGTGTGTGSHDPREETGP